ncbi:MAG: hypothetical protein ABIE74_10900 [Pseudomonadota bacterium]
MGIENSKHRLSVGFLANPIMFGDSEFEGVYQFRFGPKKFRMGAGLSVQWSPLKGSRSKVDISTATSSEAERAGISGFVYEKSNRISALLNFSGTWYFYKGRHGQVGVGGKLGAGISNSYGDLIIQAAQSGLSSNISELSLPTDGSMIWAMVLRGGLFSEYVFPRSFMALYIKASAEAPISIQSNIAKPFTLLFQVGGGIVVYLDKIVKKAGKNGHRIPQFMPTTNGTASKPTTQSLSNESFQKLHKAFLAENQLAFRAAIAAKQAKTDLKRDSILEAKRLLAETDNATKKRKKLEKQYPRLSNGQRKQLYKLVATVPIQKMNTKNDINQAEQTLRSRLQARKRVLIAKKSVRKGALSSAERGLSEARSALRVATTGDEVLKHEGMKKVARAAKSLKSSIQTLITKIKANNKSLSELRKLKSEADSLYITAKRLHAKSKRIKRDML